MRVPTQLPSDARQASVQERLRDLSVRYEAYIVTQNFQFTPQDEIDSLQADATAGNLTVTLPPPTGNRRRRIIKTDASANTVTVTAGGILINGVTSHILSVRYGNITVEPTGTSWIIVGWNTQVIIAGGTIDNTPIGGTTPAPGAFTTLSANNTVTFSKAAGDVVLILSSVGGSGRDWTFKSTTGGALSLGSDLVADVLVVTGAGATITGAAKITGLAGVGTRNVVVDANGNLSAP